MKPFRGIVLCRALGRVGLVLLVLAAFASACGRRDEAPSGKGGGNALNVVILTLDTLRADHVGCYGSPDVETPALDRLAAEGVQFMNAVTAAPLTLPSHSSLFTGTYPPAHGVEDNVGYALPGEEETLAELFRQAGRRTAAFVSAYVLNRCFGISQGFDLFDDDIPMKTSKGPLSPDAIQRKGEETMGRAVRWIEKNRAAPFFLWVHLFDPHSPYTPPEPFASRYPYNPYDGEVAYTDSLVGRLLDVLERTGLAGRTVVMVVGDHGEGLGEHKESYHGLFLYDSTLRVPFIVRVPGCTHRRVEGPVRLIDAAPTLLDLAGLAVPEHMEGRSLAPLMRGQSEGRAPPAYSETLFPRLHYGWSDLACVRTDRFKYIAAPKPELYDLKEDPREQRNLAAERPDMVKKMALLLNRIRAGSRGRAREGDRTVQVDARGAEALRLLGYTGTVSPAGKTGSRGNLPDPKDKAALLLESARAERLLSGGDYEGAARAIRSVLAEAPDMVDARITLGVALLEGGRLQEAVKELRECARQAPQLFIVWANLGMALHRLGKEGESFRAFKHALELNPSNLVAMGQMIDACFRTGRFRKGVELCREYLERMPEAKNVKTTLAWGLVNFQKYDEAHAVLKELLAADSRAPKVHYLLGKVLEARKDLSAAAEAYEKEIELYGGNEDVWCSLAGVYRKLGRDGEELKILEEGARRFPRDGNVQYMLAEAYARRGMRDDALRAARRASALNPNSLKVKALLRSLGL